MGLSMMSFFPLDTISAEASAIYANLENDLQRGISEKRYSELYEKQFGIQLERIRNGQANCETVLAQGGAPTIPGELQLEYFVFDGLKVFDNTKTPQALASQGRSTSPSCLC